MNQKNNKIVKFLVHFLLAAFVNGAINSKIKICFLF